MKLCYVCIYAIAQICFASKTMASTPNEYTDEHATVSLLAEKNSFKPGTRVWVGIKIAHRAEWHTYWINPGDSGLATRLEWQLPNGFRAGEVVWPAPKRFDLGGLYNFGYDDTVLLLVPIDVSPQAHSNGVAQLAVNAKWLICSHEVCIPRKATLALSTTISNDEPTTNPKTESLFAKTRTSIPKPVSWAGEARLVGDRVRIELRGANLPGETPLDVFSVSAKILSNVPPRLDRSRDRIAIDAEKSEYFDTTPKSLQLVLTEPAIHSERVNAWQVEVPLIASDK